MALQNTQNLPPTYPCPYCGRYFPGDQFYDLGGGQCICQGCYNDWQASQPVQPLTYQPTYSRRPQRRSSIYTPFWILVGLWLLDGLLALLFSRDGSVGPAAICWIIFYFLGIVVGVAGVILLIVWIIGAGVREGNRRD